MILKSLGRKEPTFRQLVAYFLNPKEAEIAITQNFRVGTEAPTAIVQQFEENYALLPKRKNDNALYHKIIALPPNCKSSKREQVAALKEIAKKVSSKQSRIAFDLRDDSTVKRKRRNKTPQPQGFEEVVRVGR